MKHPLLAQDVVPLDEVQQDLGGWARRVGQSRRPLVLTEEGRPSAVLVDPATLDELDEERMLVRKVLRGLRDIEEGRVHEHEDVMQQMEAIIRKAEG